MRAIFKLVLLCLFTTSVFYGQKTKTDYADLHFYLINSQDGLSNNIINDITQDSLGFIWIATYDGLNRYDGTQFLKFRKSLESDKNSVSNNYIQELQLLGKNQLLIASDAGLNLYNLATETFDILTVDQGLLDNSVSALALDKAKNPIIGTYRGGIQKLSKDQNFTTLDLSSAGSLLSSNEIATIATQNDSTIWVGTYDKGLNKVVIKGTKTKTTLIKHPKLVNATVYQIYIDSEENLWAATDTGLFVIQSDGTQRFLSKANTPEQGLSDSDIMALVDDQNGSILLGTRYGGLNVLDKKEFLEGKRLDIQWLFPKTDGSSVFDRSITSLFIDRDRGLWIGTPTGINYVDLMGEPAKSLRKNAGNLNAISDDRISALASKSKNQLWIGTDGEGLDLYDLNEGRIKNYRHRENDRQSLSNNSILSLLPKNDEEIWAGTYQGGINLLNHKTGAVKHYLEGAPQDGSDVRSIFYAKDSTLWVGTNRGGLYRYNEPNDQFDFINRLEKLDIRGIDEYDGYLWLATFGSGLVKYRISNGDSQYYNSANVVGLNTDIFFAIKILEDGKILLGTRYNGLKLFDPKNETIKTFSEKDGLKNNSINSLVLQNDDYLWIGTYTGINRFNLKTQEISSFDFLNNVQNEGVGPILNDGYGRIYFGGINGLQIINTKDLERLKDQNDLVFKQLSVLNKPISPGSDAILNKALPFEKNIELAYFQNSFSFYFTALKYPSGQNINYAYKLDNYNAYWIETQEGVANFTDVPPGNYTLNIKTKSGSGEELVKTLAITITPPFWKTPLAYIIYVLLLITVIYMISRYYSERLKLKNRIILEQEQRRLEHELNEERLRFFTAFSHELKTPLTLILAPLDNLISDANNRSLKKQLNLINRNAKKLSSAINKLLEFRKSEEGLSRLNLSNHNISDHLSKWVKNYIPLATDKQITIKTNIEESNQRYLYDLEKLKIIVNNLLSNAVKYCDDNGTIEVNLYINKNTLDISVSDNGAGIDAQELEEIFNWYYRSEAAAQKSGTGIGLALSKRFAELHKGTLKVKSSPNVKTTFMLEIPKLTYKEPVAELDKNTALKADEALIVESEMIKVEKENSKSIGASENRSLILVIDDNPDILNFLDEILKGDYDLVFANNGEEGIKKAQKFIPDLVISDIMMPKKNGIDLCRALKNDLATSHIPIILLTAKGNLESLKTGYEEGADDYISKPFQPQILKTRISNLIRNREAVQRFLQNKELPQKVAEPNSPALNKEKEFLAKLDAIIHENIGSENENVFDIAKELGMSRTSLYRKLKSITGYSINEYTRNLKLEKAADLIENQEYSVSQAAYEVGFNSPKYFRKIFKEMYGKLPSEFKS